MSWGKHALRIIAFEFVYFAFSENIKKYLLRFIMNVSSGTTIKLLYYITESQYIFYLPYTYKLRGFLKMCYNIMQYNVRHITMPRLTSQIAAL